MLNSEERIFAKFYPKSDFIESEVKFSRYFNRLTNVELAELTERIYMKKLIVHTDIFEQKVMFFFRFCVNERSSE